MQLFPAANLLFSNLHTATVSNVFRSCDAAFILRTRSVEYLTSPKALDISSES